MDRLFSLLRWMLVIGTFIESTASMHAAEDLSHEKIRICLFGIVQDQIEGTALDKALRSAPSHIDCAIIWDANASTQKQRMMQMVQSHKSQGKENKKCESLYIEGEAYTHATGWPRIQELLQKKGYALSHTYLLFVQPGQHCMAYDAVFKQQLHQDAYLIPHQAFNLFFYAPNLLRASLTSSQVGELISEEKPLYRPEPLPSLDRLNSLALLEGDEPLTRHCFHQKLLRAIEREKLVNEENASWLLWRGHAYKVMQKNDSEAIDCYRKCLEKGKDAEEKWLATYMIAECQQNKRQWQEAINGYLEAYHLDPHRSEPLKALSHLYRNQDKNHLAYLFAKHGSQMPMTACDRRWFLYHPASNYCFDEEIAITAFYTSSTDEGYRACSRLMIHKYVPWQIKTRAFQNILFYTPALKHTSYIPLSIYCPFIRPNSPQRYQSMNTAIRKTTQGYELICRTVNYVQIGGRHFTGIDPLGGDINTRNFLVLCNRKFDILSQQEILEELPRPRIMKRYPPIWGLEDCRQIQFGMEKWFTCSTCDTNPTGCVQVSLVQLEDVPDERGIHVKTLIPLEGPDPHRHEKNWLPFVRDGKLHVIYSYSPWTIHEIDPHTGKYREVIKQDLNCDFSEIRGSAPPIAFDDGYLILVHEVMLNDVRHYLHRFVYLDRHFNINKISRPFRFLHDGIEYCCGMTTDHAEENLVLAVSIEDRATYLCVTPLDTVREMLEELPAAPNATCIKNMALP